MKKIREYFTRTSTLKFAIMVLLITFVLYIVLLAYIMIDSLLRKGGLYCPTFGGDLKCSILEFLIMGSIYFIWYTLLFSLPLFLLTFIVILLIKKLK